jgi:hypothetical protein
MTPGEVLALLLVVFALFGCIFWIEEVMGEQEDELRRRIEEFSPTTTTKETK